MLYYLLFLTKDLTQDSGKINTRNPKVTKKFKNKNRVAYDRHSSKTQSLFLNVFWRDILPKG